METQIETNVPMPEEPAKKPRASRARKQAAGANVKKTLNPAASLLAAIKFVSVAQEKTGPTNVQFSHISHNWVAASNGILTAACKIEEDLSACVNTMQFIDALSKVNEEVSIVQLNANSLCVSSGAFRAVVPCVDFDEVPINPPDPQCAVIDDRIKEAISAVAGLATEGSPNAVYGAVLLHANTAVATNGAAMLEAWHGIDLPPGLLIPKASANAIAKAKKALSGFGYSNSSATFYFEDGSFIKTQLYAERYPEYEHVLTEEGMNLWAIPEDFYKGVKALEAFSPSGNVYFESGKAWSNTRVEDASTYSIEGLPERMGFAIKMLLLVEHAFKKVHFVAGMNKVLFQGENVRGALMGLDWGTERIDEVNNFDSMDDDIPF